MKMTLLPPDPQRRLYVFLAEDEKEETGVRADLIARASQLDNSGPSSRDGCSIARASVLLKLG